MENISFNWIDTGSRIIDFGVFLIVLDCSKAMKVRTWLSYIYRGNERYSRLGIKSCGNRCSSLNWNLSLMAGVWLEANHVLELDLEEKTASHRGTLHVCLGLGPPSAPWMEHGTTKEVIDMIRFSINGDIIYAVPFMQVARR